MLDNSKNNYINAAESDNIYDERVVAAMSEEELNDDYNGWNPEDDFMNSSPDYGDFESEDFECSNCNPQVEYEKHLEEETLEQAKNASIQEYPHPNLPDISKLLNSFNGAEQFAGKGSREIDTNQNLEISIEENDTSQEMDVKIVLNDYIKDFSSRTPEHWQEIAEDFDANDLLGGKTSAKKIYKLGLCDILQDCSNENGWNIAKDGGKTYVYNHKFWIETDSSIVKEFIVIAAIKLSIPKSFYLDLKFIDEVYTQLYQSKFFKKMNPPDETLINVQNCTLKIGLNGIEKLVFNSNHYVTHQLGFPYDTLAVNNSWLQFLDRVLPDRDTQRTLQQAIGYLLTQGLKLEVVIFLFGLGSNGKSVIAEILNSMFGSYLISNHSLKDLFGSSSYYLSDLNDRLINYSSDDSMKTLSHGRFKQIASGEPIGVRQIYGQPFTMKKYAKLIVNLNRIDDADVESTIGFFRRMVFIPFEMTIPKEEQDKLLHEKILQNKAGILNWILEGTSEVLTNQEIFISQKCSDFLENFKKESNLAIRFAEEYSLVSSTTETIGFQYMYDKFVNFCKKEGEKAMTKRSFNSELRKLKFQENRHSNGMVWYAKFNS